MYIETRTSHAEVLADIRREVVHMANRVINGARIIRAHPTYLTKTQFRHDYERLTGAFELAQRVHGDDTLLSGEVNEKMGDAHAAFISIVGGAK
jgi:hypothetical protein